MFSLLVGLNGDVVPQGRLFEYTDEEARKPFDGDHISRLQHIPALRMPEVKDETHEQVARVGSIASIRRSDAGHRFTFVPNSNLEPISSSTIMSLAGQLGVDPTSWEFTRTHWAVKDVDLFEVLLEHQMNLHRGGSGNFRSSGAVQFPVGKPRDTSLVAVMMPFSRMFDVVYETIELAVADAGLHCARADDIWDHDLVMGDVLSLLWRSTVVIADLTGKNTNVFYEAGLAHALPRRTVLLTQDPDDVPFDLRSIRYLHYGVGTAERATLRKQLSERLTTLVAQSDD
ncbi:hypothetical protein [Cellulomonas citrea]|uniref:hypothetical protein n=1 Tax=Cellulomonas citrea TaxID=1909423 RepID=UPI001359C686|nr:hypothetical protein [Cellulomonas citrea]